ncbi:MAG: acetylxylan esterase [Planctomycetota bacterium]
MERRAPRLSFLPRAGHPAPAGILLALLIFASGGCRTAEKSMTPSPAFQAWLAGGKGDAPRQAKDALFIPELDAVSLQNGWPSASAWNTLSAVPFVFLDGSGDTPQAPTTMRVATAAGEILFHFTCLDPDATHLVYTSSGHDSPMLWREDVIEINLAPDAARGVCFMVGAGGGYSDADASGNVAWDPPVRRRVERTHRGWTAEFAVPLRALVAEGGIPPVWRANISRERQGRPGAFMESTGWRPTGSLRCAVPEHYGYLFLDAVGKGAVPATPPAAPAGTDILTALGNPDKAADALRGLFRAPAAAVPVAPADPSLGEGPDGPSWKVAAEITLIPSTGGTDPDVGTTTVKICRRRDSLFVAVRCNEPRMGTLVAKERPDGGDIWRDDSVEIFLAPHRKESAEYRQISVNPAGSIYTGRGTEPTPLPGISVKTGRGPGHWTVALRIPFESFPLTPEMLPALWGFNVIRNRADRAGEPAASLVWSRFPWSAHDPGRFGTLWLAGAPVLPILDPKSLNECARDGARRRALEAPPGPLPFNPDVFTPEERDKRDLRSMASRHLDAIRLELLQKRDAELAAINSPETWKPLREKIRENFRRSIGALPTEKTPLNPRSRISFEDDNLRVENLVFESQPKFHVTANLFLPKKAPRPLPVIIRTMGHSSPGRFLKDGFLFAEAMANAGYAVLIMDSVGQGERILLNNIRSSTREHDALGIPCVLTGANLAAWMIHDVIRAIDYLETRSEVDSKRIALTGASGGGTITAYVAALDDRLFAAAPVAAGHVGRESGGADSEQTLFREIPDFIDGEGKLACFAPKPLCVIREAPGDAAEKKRQDDSYVNVRRIYALHGAEGKFTVHLTDEPHGYGEGHFRLFKEWILPVMPPNPGTPPPPGKPAGFSGDACHATASWRAFFSRDLPGAETVPSLNTRRITPYAGGDVREILRTALALSPHPVPAVRATPKGSASFGGNAVEKIVLETEPGILLPALLFKPRKATKPAPAVLWLSGGGKKALLRARGEEIRTALDRGVAVVLLDLRGTGEAAGDFDPTTEGMETSLNYYSFRTGRPLIGMRVVDVMAATAWLRTRPDVDPARIGIFGDSLSMTNPPHLREVRLLTDPAPELRHPADSLGPVAALLAFALDGKIAAASAHGAPASFANLCEPPCAYHPASIIIPGILRFCDLDTIATLGIPRPLCLTGSVSGLNQKIAETGAGDAAFGELSAAYKRAGRNLVLRHNGSARDAAEALVSVLGK